MPHRQTRNVSLTPELEAFIADRLATGDYGNASEVVRAGLKRLRETDAPAANGDWLIGGGACGDMIRAHDWGRSSLGPIGGWSAALRATVSNIVNSPVPKVLMWGNDHVMLYNDAYRAIAGSRHPQALGGTVPGVWPEVWDFNRPVLERGLRGEVVSFRDHALTVQRNRTPENVTFDLFFTPVRDGVAVGGVMATVIENTGRVAAERAVARSEAELRRIADALPLLVVRLDRGHRVTFANPYNEAWFGLSPRAMLGRHLSEFVGETDYAERRGLLEQALSGRPAAAEIVLPCRDGTRRRCEARYLPSHDREGAVEGVLVVAVDIEDRARQQEAQEAANRRFRTAMDAVHGVLWTNSPDGRMQGEQPGWAALTGQSVDAYQGYGWADAVHPEDAPATIAAWNAAVAARGMFVFEHRVRHRDGSWRSFAIRGLPIMDASGAILEWVGVHTDITHQRAAEAALRAQAETLAAQVRHREAAETQLRQLNETLETRVIAEIAERRQAEAKLARAQKLETIGKLTGGVAHDFNNLLQVVAGNLQLLGRDVAGNERAERRVAHAMAGVTRGARLAAQLLAFGRRQALEPKVVNVTRFVQGMEEILRRAVGEAVEIETVFGAGLWNTFIDPAQVENALLNLAINARDAMAGQGKLTVELANAFLDDAYAAAHDEVEAGQYVMLAVTDTGCGMAPEIAAKVFEPFFSTKPEGKGSGLGLSMVYGFVRQSGGHVKIYSEPGHGTTIRLYLPRAMQAEDVAVAIETGPVLGGSETVLVVEDDDAVRATVVELLAELGYRVLRAVDAASALSVIESGIPIDLLFTDVVMPGTLKSPELARKARERLPDIAVLFTSGYTENAIVHGGRLDAGLELLSKPYTREALARKLRHVLGNRAQRRQTDTPASASGSGPTTAQGPAAGALRGRTVLLVEDDTLIRANTIEMMEEDGATVVAAGSAEAALDVLARPPAEAPVDVLVTDINLPGLSGPALASQAHALRPALAIVFASGDAAPLARGELAGSIALAKPYDRQALSGAILAALAHTAMRDAG